MKSKFVKFISPKELFISSSGFNYYYCNFKKKGVAALDTPVNALDKKATIFERIRQLAINFLERSDTEEDESEEIED